MYGVWGMFPEKINNDYSYTPGYALAMGYFALEKFEKTCSS